VWALEQNLAIGPLETPLRCVVVKLDSGQLWVHAPLAPTEEFFTLIESLGAPVGHIVAGTYLTLGEKHLTLLSFLRSFIVSYLNSLFPRPTNVSTNATVVYCSLSSVGGKCVSLSV
jgi:hypothetical protein